MNETVKLQLCHDNEDKTVNSLWDADIQKAKNSFQEKQDKFVK